MKVDYVTKGGHKMDIRSHVGDKLKHFTVTQGACYGDGHLYMAFERKDPHAIKIVKMRFPSLEVVKVSDPLYIGHANDMAYRKGILYVTHSAGSSVIHRVDAKTLTKKKGIKVGDAHYNGIATYGSGFILRVMGGSKMLIVNKRWHKVRTIKTEKTYTTSQGMVQKGGVIYRAYSKAQSKDKNFLVKFDKRGQVISRRRVEVTGELECVFLVDGQVWFTVYRKKRVKGKMRYYAYLAKERSK